MRMEQPKLSINREINLKDFYESKSGIEDITLLTGYKIYQIKYLVNSECYIGDTIETIHKRFFDGPYGNGHFQNYDRKLSKHLYNAINKYGIENFTLRILSTNPNDTEEFFIELYDSFYNGYNNNPSGKGFNNGSGVKGKFVVSNGTIYKFVKPNEIDYYLNLGWIRGYGNLGPNSINSSTSKSASHKNRIIIHKDDIQRRVFSTDLDKLLLDGWKLGFRPDIKSRSTATQINNKTAIFSDKAKENRDKFNQHQLDNKLGFSDPINKSKGAHIRNLNVATINLNLIKEYLINNNLELNEVNYNLARYGIGKYINQVPSYNKYLNKYHHLLEF